MSNLDEVAFEMIGDDYNATRDQLNSIRGKCACVCMRAYVYDTFVLHHLSKMPVSTTPTCHII